MTQKETVALLPGGGHNAFSRYERGEIAPPKSLMVLMRLLDRDPIYSRTPRPCPKAQTCATPSPAPSITKHKKRSKPPGQAKI